MSLHHDLGRDSLIEFRSANWVKMILPKWNGDTPGATRKWSSQTDVTICDQMEYHQNFLTTRLGREWFPRGSPRPKCRWNYEWTTDKKSSSAYINAHYDISTEVLRALSNYPRWAPPYSHISSVHKHMNMAKMPESVGWNKMILWATIMTQWEMRQSELTR